MEESLTLSVTAQIILTVYQMNCSALHRCALSMALNRIWGREVNGDEHTAR